MQALSSKHISFQMSFILSFFCKGNEKQAFFGVFNSFSYFCIRKSYPNKQSDADHGNWNGCQLITRKQGNSSNSLDFKVVYSLYWFTKKKTVMQILRTQNRVYMRRVRRPPQWPETTTSGWILGYHACKTPSSVIWKTAYRHVKVRKRGAKRRPFGFETETCRYACG